MGSGQWQLDISIKDNLVTVSADYGRGIPRESGGRGFSKMIQV